jgi:predicted O-methyltransferase YrrM
MDAPLPANLMEHWGRLLATEGDRPRGENAYSEVFDDSVLFPLQRKAELSRMMMTARALAPKVVMEIGADKGGGFYHWIKCLPTVRKAIAIELRGVPYASAFRGAFPYVSIMCRAGSSMDGSVIADVKNFLAGDPIDCLFIDGDKASTGKDFAIYSPFVRKGGLVFIHDVVDKINPRAVFNTLAARYDSESIVDVSEGLEARARERAGIPAATSHEAWNRVWGNTSCGVGVLHV